MHQTEHPHHYSAELNLSRNYILTLCSLRGHLDFKCDKSTYGQLAPMIFSAEYYMSTLIEDGYIPLEDVINDTLPNFLKANTLLSIVSKAQNTNRASLVLLNTFRRTGVEQYELQLSTQKVAYGMKSVMSGVDSCLRVLIEKLQ